MTWLYMAQAAPQVGQAPPKEIKIISQTNEISPEGGYEWRWVHTNEIYFNNKVKYC